MVAKRRRPITKKKVTIFCEGVGDEKYIQWLNTLEYYDRLSFKALNIKGNGHFDKINKKIRSLLLSEENAVFCIFMDIDNGVSKKYYESCMKQLKDHDFCENPEERIFFTNYSFELFILNHHEDHYCKRALNKKTYQRDIEKRFGIPEFKGTEVQWSGLLKKLTIADFENAKQNLTKISIEMSNNPSTNIKYFFDYMMTVNQSFKTN
ncbi:RloB domain-containing protein [Carnobacterium maltaromaticum]|uniref:RloB domain-containing protein n=1 Tax=Carnobacterium maltaromaticum TaxID=2751 RepID=A0AAW9JQ51_CARML|nr:RloB domain-containing protein [Carnobacterium maltaromaticum]MDZ5758587.1 RloB domain-containing protein [Carnobacterium maltaromaticum]